MGEKSLSSVVQSFSDPSKKINTRSWILIDSSGNDIVMDVDKYAIMRRVQINARDLRILDPHLSYPSSILGRERVIVLNLEHIKAIITAEEVLLRDPLDDNVIAVVEELKLRIPQTSSQADGKDLSAQQDGSIGEEDESPFELRVLEVALEAICSFLSARTLELESSAHPALDELTTKVSSRSLDRVRKIKSEMTRLTARVQKVRDELEHLLDNDDDMADLYLSRKFAGASSPVSGDGASDFFRTSPTVVSKISKASRASILGDGEDIEQIEMLIEAYFSQIDGTFNRLAALREYVDDTEDYIDIQLDTHRNKLIQIELVLSAANISLAIHALVSAAFGMNILFKWNEGYSHLFKWVVIDTSILDAIVFGLIVYYAYHKESPFEFRALEVALEAICSYLSARTSELISSAYPALDELTTKISSRNLDKVHQIKSAITRLTARVQKVRDELEHLLDGDDDMADLYLSRKLAGTSSPVSGNGAPNWFSTSPTVGSKISKASRASIHEDEEDIGQLEMLLEAYFSLLIDGTLNKLLALREYVNDTEDYIDIQLDNHRNKLIQLELLISAATLSLALHAMVSAAFGMNMLYEWNEGHSYLVKWVVIDTSVVCAIVFGITALYAHYKDLFKY